MDRSSESSPKSNLIRRMKCISLALIPLLLFWPLRARIEERRRTFEFNGSVSGIAFSKDNTSVFIAGNVWEIHAWDIATHKEHLLRSSIGVLESMAIGDDGRYLVGATSNPVKVQRWDVKNRAALNQAVDPHQNPDVTTYLLKLLPLQDGRILACSADIFRKSRPGKGNHQGLHLWDTKTGRLEREVTGIDRHLIRAVALAGDGSLLALGDSSGLVHLWDMRSRRLVRTLIATPRNPVHFYLTEEVSDVAFSRDGKTLAASGGNSVYLWNARSGQPLRTLTGGDMKWKPQLTISHNGSLVACSDASKNLRLWDVATGQQIRTINTEAKYPISALAFSPSDTQLAVGGNGNVRLWNVP